MGPFYFLLPCRAASLSGGPATALRSPGRKAGCYTHRSALGALRVPHSRHAFHSRSETHVHLADKDDRSHYLDQAFAGAHRVRMSALAHSAAFPPGDRRLVSGVRCRRQDFRPVPGL